MPAVAYAAHSRARRTRIPDAHAPPAVAPSAPPNCSGQSTCGCWGDVRHAGATEGAGGGGAGTGTTDTPGTGRAAEGTSAVSSVRSLSQRSRVGLLPSGREDDG